MLVQYRSPLIPFVLTNFIKFAVRATLVLVYFICSYKYILLVGLKHYSDIRRGWNYLLNKATISTFSDYIQFHYTSQTELWY
jgi:hypothetical protein